MQSEGFGDHSEEKKRHDNAIKAHQATMQADSKFYNRIRSMHIWT